MTARRICITLFVILAACTPVFAASNVLVVINDRSKDSVEIGEYYAGKRHIPRANICHISVRTDRHISSDEYEEGIRDRVRDYLDNHKLKGKIDYIVLTKGIPLEEGSGKAIYSVDSALTCVFSLFIHQRIPNPFYRSKSKFSFRKNDFIMVTRLDGYTKQDAKRLVDLSLAAKPAKGLFVFDVDPNRDKLDGYVEFNKMMRRGSSDLKKRGFQVLLDTSPDMCPPQKNVMGYYTWGSNDARWNFKCYAGNKYRPGAIAETLVSTSARSFDHVKGGQSLIADLIAKGITGVKGYCTEPYTIALAQGDILFDRYTKGFNLAESFYAASPFIYWRDIVVGDPLCCPYARK